MGFKILRNRIPKQIALLKWYEVNQAAKFSVGESPFGIAFDGANIWVAKFRSNNVTKLLASDGANLGTFAAVDIPHAIAFDGTSIWVANTGSNFVSKF